MKLTSAIYKGPKSLHVEGSAKTAHGEEGNSLISIGLWHFFVHVFYINWWQFCWWPFVGWFSDPLKGESWPPSKESKGHGLNHLVYVDCLLVFVYYGKPYCSSTKLLHQCGIYVKNLAHLRWSPYSPNASFELIVGFYMWAPLKV